MTSHLEALAELETKRSIFTPLANATENLLRWLAAIGRRNQDRRLTFNEEVLARKVDMFVISQYQQYLSTNCIVDMLNAICALIRDTDTIVDLLKSCVNDRTPPEACRKLRSKTGLGVPESRLLYELIVELSRVPAITGETIVG